jgi:prefoldin subunit 4
MHISLEQAQRRLATEQDAIDAEVARIQDAVDECYASMKELKVQLYAKFGTSINLD